MSTEGRQPIARTVCGAPNIAPSLVVYLVTFKAGASVTHIRRMNAVLRTSAPVETCRKCRGRRRRRRRRRRRTTTTTTAATTTITVTTTATLIMVILLLLLLLLLLMMMMMISRTVKGVFLDFGDLSTAPKNASST